MSHCYPTKPLRNKTLDAETKCAFVKDYEALGQLRVSDFFFMTNAVDGSVALSHCNVMKLPVRS